MISDALPATLSKPEVDQLTEEIVTVVGRQFMWRLKQPDLQIDGAIQTPQRDDSIEWVHCGRKYVFTVLQETSGPEFGVIDPRSEWVPANTKLVRIDDQR